MTIYTIEPQSDGSQLVWWLDGTRIVRRKFKHQHEAQLWIQVKRELNMPSPRNVLDGR